MELTLPFRPRSPLPDNSAFGPRALFNDFHTGVDFNGYTNAWNGAPVRAAGAGRITESYDGNKPGMTAWARARGTMVEIDHGFDESGDHWESRYHMLDEDTNPPVGREVELGDIIGHVSKSGTSGTGPHLHFELWKNGEPVDPLQYLSYGSIASVGVVSKIDNDRDNPSNTNTTEQEDDEDMAKNAGIYYPRAKDGATVYAILNTESGFFTEWSGIKGGYNNPIAATFGTGSFAPVTESHANALKRACLAVLPLVDVDVNIEAADASGELPS